MQQRELQRRSNTSQRYALQRRCDLQRSKLQRDVRRVVSCLSRRPDNVAITTKLGVLYNIIRNIFRRTTLRPAYVIADVIVTSSYYRPTYVIADVIVLPSCIRHCTTVMHTSLLTSLYSRTAPCRPAYLTSCALCVVVLPLDVLRNTILQSYVLRTVVVHLVVLCLAAYLIAFCRSIVL